MTIMKKLKAHSNNVRLLIICLALLPLAIVLAAPAAYAQDDAGAAKSTSVSDVQQLEEVVVTATRRTQSVMDVPFSVNVQEEADIQRLNNFNLEDLSRNIAGLNIQNLGPGQSVVNIRGISSGQIVRDQPGVKEQVGVYLDDVPIAISLFTPDLDLYDVQRVETLRGPQGTLFGSGSIGGTVRYVTNKPQLGVKEVSTQFDLNTIDSGSAGGHVKAAFNAPLGDNAAVRMVGYGTRYGGFIDALRVSGETDQNVNDGGRFGSRMSILWKPTENVTITPRLVYQSIDMNGFNREEFFNLFANPYSTTRRPVQLGERQQFLLLDEAFEDETLILDNTIKWNVNDRLEATYVASYTNRDLLVSRDASALSGSAAAFPFGNSSTPPFEFFESSYGMVGLPSNLLDATELEQMTHEVRLSSTDAGPFQWQAGVFYSNIKRNYTQRAPTPGHDSYIKELLDREGSFLRDIIAGGRSLSEIYNGFPVQDTPYSSNLTYDLSQIAVFGEATYTLFDRLDLTAGLRWYDWEEDKTFKSGGVFSNLAAQSQNVTVSSNGLTPRFMVNYDVTDRVAVNAQASRGFRLGGVNDPLNKGLCGDAYDTYQGFQRFKDETLWNYEVGLKSSYKKVTLNGSLFYTDISNLGVNVDAGSCSSRVVINVPEAHTMGGELEFAVTPTDALLLKFAGSYVEAEFDSTVTNMADGSVIDGIQDGNRIPSVPNWQLSAVATYTFPGLFQSEESYVTASWQFVGSQITQSGDQVNTQFPGSAMYVDPDGARMQRNYRDQMELDPYHLLNLNTGLLYDTWEVMFYVKNITDENPQLSFDRERGGAARLAYRVGQPRTFGLLTRFYF